MENAQPAIGSQRRLGQVLVERGLIARGAVAGALGVRAFEERKAA
jgi:hypothetical protein